MAEAFSRAGGYCFLLKNGELARVMGWILCFIGELGSHW